MKIHLVRNPGKTVEGYDYYKNGRIKVTTQRALVTCKNCMAEMPTGFDTQFTRSRPAGDEPLRKVEWSGTTRSLETVSQGGIRDDTH